MTIHRRRLLAGAAAAGAALGAAGLLPGCRRTPPLADNDPDPAAPAAAGQDEPAPPALPHRKLGRTGEEVAILTLGCFPVGKLPDEEEDEAVAVIRRALDLGVTYLDTAPSYSKHRSERRVGKAVKGRRDDVLLGTKSYVATKAGALEELEASLRALGTDRVDVFQVHAVGDAADRARKLDTEKGTLAAAIQARRDGKCRFIGVTGHADPEVMAGCLDLFDFDTMLVPVNCADPLHRSFVLHTLPRAREKGVAVIAMKVFAAGRLVAGAPPRATVEECLRFALSQQIATASVGAASLRELEADVRVARSFQPMPAPEQEALTARQAPHPGKFLEWYKRERS